MRRPVYAVFRRLGRPEREEPRRQSRRKYPSYDVAFGAIEQAMRSGQWSDGYLERRGRIMHHGWVGSPRYR